MEKMKAGLVIGLILCLTLAVNSKRCDAEQNSGLVACWSMDEAQGKIIKDKSGGGNKGSIHGAEWVENIPGHALKFDGVDDYCINYIPIYPLS